MKKNTHRIGCTAALLGCFAGCSVAPGRFDASLSSVADDAHYDSSDALDDSYASENTRQDLVSKETDGEEVGEVQEPLTPLGALCIFAANAMAIGGCQYLSAQCQTGT